MAHVLLPKQHLPPGDTSAVPGSNTFANPDRALRPPRANGPASRQQRLRSGNLPNSSGAIERYQSITFNDAESWWDGTYAASAADIAGPTPDSLQAIRPPCLSPSLSQS